MRIEARLVLDFRGIPEERARDVLVFVGLKREIEEKYLTGLQVVKIYKDCDKYKILRQKLKEFEIDFLETEDEIFTKKELLSSPILCIIPNAHRGGYPQPEGGEKEENYQGHSYDLDTGCKYCTRGRLQNRPLRLKSSVKMGNNDMSGIWWMRELVVTKKLRNLIEDAELTGCEFWPLIKHGKNVPFEDIFQLKIVGTLPAMSAKTNIIYEREWIFEGRKMKSCPYGCGERYVKGSIYYCASDLVSILDFALTQEWFGSNDEYWRWPFLSQKAYRLFVDNKIKGVRFYPPVVVE
ncbi:MAG: hypothetical protein LBK75_10070 [Oscillospiraceae bacterium]|nr:hypothetical protein [Oscillospiraceae bacterium]